MKKNYLKLILVVMLLFTYSSFSQDLGASDKVINTISNSNSSINADTDGDGVDDSVDLDADNDGILDSYECLVAIQFNTPSLLTATDLSNLQVGEKVLYHDALLYQGTYYDIILTLTSVQGTDLTVDVNTELEVINFKPNQNQYVTYTFDLVESGSASASNPVGVPASLNNLIIELRDLDHGINEDYTEVFGYNNSSILPSNISTYFNSTTYLHTGGFLSGGPTGYTLFRLNPTLFGSTTNWFDEPSDTTSSSPDFTVYMHFNAFSHIELILGVTGSDTLAGLRHTQFGADSTCDDDNDGVENKFDIDSDNDGIPDNVEAQSTSGYIAPNGGVNANGVLLVYGTGIAPQDTDGDGAFDYIDYDSDNDGILDLLENGSLSDTFNTSDQDGDGLMNLFETNGTNDTTWDVNEDIEDPTDLSILTDQDGDIPFGGDLDYRDAINNYKESASLDFDGIDDHVIGTPVFYQFNESNTNGVTLMAWIKSDSDAADSNTKFVLGEENAIELTIQDEAIKSKLSYVTALGATGSVTASYGTSGITRGIWRHVTVVVSFIENKITLYLDGAFVYSSIAPTNIIGFESSTTSQNENFRLGADSSLNTSQFFKGSMDEIRAFKTILSDDEIKEIIYQEIENDSGVVEGAVIKNNLTGTAWTNLEMYYPFTSILTGRIPDESIYGHDATMYNITSVQEQTAPMPFATKQDGTWEDKNTWLHGDIWYIPGDEFSEYAAFGNDETVTWGIYHIKNNVTATTSMSLANVAGYYQGLVAYGVIVDEHDTSNNDIAFTIGNDTTDMQLNITKCLQLNGVIDLKGDSQLVQTSGSNLVTEANGRILRRQEGNLNYYWYNYWSAPVGATAVTNNSNTNFTLNMLKDAAGTPMQFTNAFHETGKISTDWLYTYQNGLTYWHWSQITPSTPLQPGIGYSQKGTGNTNGEQQYIFEGKPNNGTIQIIADDVDGDELNESQQNVTYVSSLIGNPYPSALNARQFIIDNTPSNGGISNGVLYVWEQWAGTSHVLSEYQGGYGTITQWATERAYLWNNLLQQDGVKTPTFYIPVSQGFFTEIIGDGNIEFNNGQRMFVKESDSDGNANNGSVFFRSSSGNQSTNTQANDSNGVGLIRLEFSTSNGDSRRFVLGFSDQTTDGLDYGYDAKTVDPQDDDLCSTLNGNKMIIQAFSAITEDKVVDLTFNSTGNYTYTIEMVEISNIPDNQAIYLRDNFTGNYHDLRNGAYNFSSIFNGEDANRFDIVFHPGDTLSNDDFITDNVVIYVNDLNDLLYVKGLNENVKQLNIINMLGQNILSLRNINKNSLQNGLDISGLSTGIYIINFTLDNNQTFDKKVLIK